MQQPPFVNRIVSQEMDAMVNGEYKLNRRLPKPIELILVLGVFLSIKGLILLKLAPVVKNKSGWHTKG